ncbi:MAG: hypothetical protein CM1200mP15_21380 [Dehalococcoidia bacterium]|nr:MAG: hypothetical protein CM1200mP15_21380 [Dehalococcoidia bacterium]
MERLAADYIPKVMSRGSMQVRFSEYLGAIAAAKIMNLTEEQINNVIGMWYIFRRESGKGPRSGGRALREGAPLEMLWWRFHSQ